MTRRTRPRHVRRRLLTALALALASAAAVILWAVEPEPRREPGCAERPDCAPYGGTAWPDAWWRPYGAGSPFNRPLPEEPRVHPRSDAIVAALEEDGRPAELRAGGHDTPDDFYKAVYYARPGDPEVTVRCTMRWGRCALEGKRIRLPEGARAAAGDDGHLTVVDQEHGWEHDLWQARPVDGDGVLRASWGGRIRIDGDGLGSDATAARFGNLAGLVRAEELEAGHVDHALFITVPCAGDERWVAPATKGGAPCSPTGDQPLLGMRLQLDMTSAEIDRLRVPGWKRGLLHAMARYGMYVGDTGGPAGWALQLQSDTSYTALGQAPRLERLARRTGWRAVEEPAVDRTLRLGDLASGVDWRRLRVIDPCEAGGTCGQDGG